MVEMTCSDLLTRRTSKFLCLNRIGFSIVVGRVLVPSLFYSIDCMECSGATKKMERWQTAQ